MNNLDYTRANESFREFFFFFFFVVVVLFNETNENLAIFPGSIFLRRSVQLGY